MSDHDRLDRMERKLNRIGKFVLFGVALYSLLLVVELEQLPTSIFFGYGNLALATFVAVMTIVLITARAPFRD
jgi:hypothetical protein